MNFFKKGFDNEYNTLLKLKIGDIKRLKNDLFHKLFSI